MAGDAHPLSLALSTTLPFGVYLGEQVADRGPHRLGDLLGHPDGRHAKAAFEQPHVRAVLRPGGPAQVSIAVAA